MAMHTASKATDLIVFVKVRARGIGNVESRHFGAANQIAWMIFRHSQSIITPIWLYRRYTWILPDTTRIQLFSTARMKCLPSETLLPYDLCNHTQKSRKRQIHIKRPVCRFRQWLLEECFLNFLHVDRSRFFHEWWDLRDRSFSALNRVVTIPVLPLCPKMVRFYARTNYPRRNRINAIVVLFLQRLPNPTARIFPLS